MIEVGVTKSWKTFKVVNQYIYGSLSAHVKDRQVPVMIKYDPSRKEITVTSKSGWQPIDHCERYIKPYLRR